MLGTKIFAIAAAVLNFVDVDGYGYYGYRHRHHHVGCWGYNACSTRRGPPVCEKWCIVYVTIGYCQQARYQCCGYKEKPGYCPTVQPFCPWSLINFSTKLYECYHDYNCPTEYKCCRDSCFSHKVCKPCTSIPPQPTISTTTTHCCITRDTEETTLRPFTITTKPEETTTDVVTTSEAEETPVETTTEITTTEPPETTTEEMTTPMMESSDPEMTITTTISITTTDMNEIRPGNGDGSGDGEGTASGDEGIVEPEAARIISGFADDEDLRVFPYDYVNYA